MADSRLSVRDRERSFIPGHSFLATSGPVIRASSEKVAAMMPRATRIPPADEVVRDAGHHHRVMLRHGGALRGGAEPGADRGDGDGEQRNAAFQRDHSAQRGQPGPGELQQAGRPFAVGEPGRDARGERAAGDRQADQDHGVRELLVGVVAGVILADQVGEGGRRAEGGIRGCVLKHRPGPFDRWPGAVCRHVGGVHPEAVQPRGRDAHGQVIPADVVPSRGPSSPSSGNAAPAAPAGQRPRAGTVASCAHETAPAGTGTGGPDGKAPSRPAPCPRPHRAKSAPCPLTAWATTPPWKPLMSWRRLFSASPQASTPPDCSQSCPDQPGSRPTGGCASVVPGSAPATPIPSCSSRSGTPGRRCFSWTRPNRYAMHSPYAVPGAGPGQRPGGRGMGRRQ